MNVNEIIMNKRIERGVSRKELAEGLGVSESTIYRKIDTIYWFT